MTKVNMYSYVIQTISIFLILAIILLTSCSNHEAIKSTFDAEEILSYVSYQQSDDGGFTEAITLSNINYNDYYDTYCALYVLDLLGYELTDAQHSRALDFINKIDFDALLDSDDNLDIIFFYLRIADFLNYELSEKQLERMLNYITSLQTKDGYFVNSSTRRELLEKGELEIELLSPLNLFTIANIIELSKTYEIKLDYINLLRYLNLFLDEKHVDDSVITQVAAIALIIDAQELWELHIDESNSEEIRKLYTETIQKISMHELDIGSLHNLVKVGNYLGVHDHSIISEALHKYFNENGFSPSPNTKNHIMATRIALLAFDEISATLEIDAKDSIIAYVLNNQFYDGRFVFDRKDIFYPARIEDTYNAVLLLNELGALDMYLPDLKRFYYSRLKDITLDEYSLYDAFYLISIAAHCGIPVEEYDMVRFVDNFSKYVSETKALDYQFAVSVMEHLAIWNVAYSDGDKAQLIASANRDNYIKNYLTELMALYYKYITYKAMSLEYTYYSDVIDYFNMNFDKLENKIFASKYIARIIQDEQLSPNKIKNRREIFKEIDNCRDDILFSYTDDFHGTFDSTASIIAIIRNLGD